MAKLNRERKLVEKRLEKRARKAARKNAAAGDLAQDIDSAPADDENGLEPEPEPASVPAAPQHEQLQS